MSTEDSLPDIERFARSVSASAAAAEREQTIWRQGAPLLPVVIRAAMARQRECLDAAIKLNELGQGFSTVAFVRPACEEYLWLKYLARLSGDDAEEFIELFVRRGVLEVLAAQEDFIGSEETVALGLGGLRQRFDSAVEAELPRRAELGRRLKWDTRAIKEASPPSTWFVAKQVEEVRLYRFLYSASSRHVHFNPPELLRRVWGRRGVLEIGSHTFGSYFAAFGLVWLARLLTMTVRATASILPDAAGRFLDHDEEELKELFVRVGLMPIATADEFGGALEPPDSRGAV